MGSTLVQGLAIWLGLSVVVMVGMTGVVMITRARAARESDTLVDLSSEPEVDLGRASLGREGRPRPSEYSLPTRHQVTDQSSVLERLLAGMMLPCELAPSPTLSADRWLFVTHGHQPRIVALAIVEELERLGLDVHPVGYTEARARREGLELLVVLHADDESLQSDHRDLHPTALTGDTVVEFLVP